MIEINASPDRRDLNDIHARAAAQAGVRILVELRRPSQRDIHQYWRYGIATARRAWLTTDQVANTLRGRTSRSCASASQVGAAP